MSFFIVLILLVITFRLLWPHVRVWLFRRMQNKAEDYLRSAAGMPPRDKSRGDGRKKQNPDNSSYYHSGQDDINVADEMKKVAVDVEFTEVHEYSENIEISKHNGATRYTVEQQVSDAEYVVIKDKQS